MLYGAVLLIFTSYFVYELRIYNPVSGLIDNFAATKYLLEVVYDINNQRKRVASSCLLPNGLMSKPESNYSIKLLI